MSLTPLKNFLILLCVLLFSIPFYAQSERITNFDVQLEVNIDRSISVIEKITVYAAGNVIKRGITRNFPSHRNLNGRSVKMKYDIVAVQKNGIPEPHFEEYSDQDYTLYIGDRNVFLKPGEYTYVIEYKVPNQIGFFTNYDEIYWNAIGTDVAFEVEKATCQITVPSGASIIQETAYTGYRGEQNKEYTMTSGAYVLTYKTTRALNPHEAFTVAVGFQKGMVEQPGLLERFGTLIVILLGLLFLFPYYIYTWWRYGQDPPTPASYPIYESPDQLSAASINYIFKEGYQSKSFTASIIELAIKGYLKIEETEGSGIFVKSKNFDLIRLKDADESLAPEEQRLFNSLLSGRNKVSIDGEYHSYVETAYSTHKTSLQHQHRTFIREGHNSKFLVTPILATIFIAGLSFFLFFNNPYAEGINLPVIFGFIALAIIGLFLYNYLIKKPTVTKLDLKSRIKGFLMYLEMAEKDRLNLLNPPELTPQHFEQALPFAFALGVEHLWSDRFKKILEASQYRPEWNNSADPIYFSNNFGRSFSNNVKGSATKPQDTSTGGGSSGGGFSGGGGGGGGVGGW